MINLLVQKVAFGLKRKSITTPAQWAETYRVMKKGKWLFTYHPWLYELHNITSPLIVGEKSAQMGFTEWALNMTFFNIDILQTDCLYILPTNDDASDFSASRFNPALESSPHLQNLFDAVQNVNMKRAGQATLYVRGSRSRNKLKSIPTGFIVFDEMAEMVQNNVPLALERASGQDEKQILMISTPTIPDKNIDAFYKQTTQEVYFFRCPCCSRFITFDFTNLVITAESIIDRNIINSHYICTYCHNPLPSDKFNYLKPKDLGGNACYVPQFSNRINRGVTINQLFSSFLKPHEIATSYLKSLTDPSSEQEFYNSKLGVPHVVAGAQITDQNIINCTRSYKKCDPWENPITMGIDVGRVLHVVIEEWKLPKNRTPGLEINDESICKVINEFTISDVDAFLTLDQFFTKYNVNFAVIDRQPETREAYKFATRFYGLVYLCQYGKGINGKQININKDELTITVDRTSWLDLSFSRFKNQTILLPQDTSEEYKRHIKEPVRLYRKDSTGNQIGFYDSAKADHFAHARNYSEIAFNVLMHQGQSADMYKIM